MPQEPPAVHRDASTERTPSAHTAAAPAVNSLEGSLQPFDPAGGRTTAGEITDDEENARGGRAEKVSPLDRSSADAVGGAPSVPVKSDQEAGDPSGVLDGPHVFTAAMTVSAGGPVASGAASMSATDAGDRQSEQESTQSDVGEPGFSPGVRIGPQPSVPRQEANALQLTIIVSAARLVVGDEVIVDVMAAAEGPILDAPFHFLFDPSVLRVVDSLPGDFLSQGGSSVVFLSDASSRPGDVSIAIGRVDRLRGAEGAGLLCRLRLEAVAAGATTLLVGDPLAWGVAGKRMSVSAVPALVIVD